jgi:hypothetical protein
MSIVLFATRSAQSIRASGRPAALTGRTRDRTRPMLQNVRKFLPGRRPQVTRGGRRTRCHSITSSACSDAEMEAHPKRLTLLGILSFHQHNRGGTVGKLARMQS